LWGGKFAGMRACDHLPLYYNAADWFIGRHVREGNGARIAIVTDEITLRYEDLDLQVRKVKELLRTSGVHRGDRVAFVLHDTPLLAILFWGAIAAGAVAVPINTLLKPADYKTIFADSDPRIIIADPSIIDAASIAPADANVWTPDVASNLIEKTSPSSEYAKTHRDAFAFFLYSSGTTGEPKGVVHLQHDMWICCATYGASILEIEPDDRCLSIAKIFFAYGLGNSLYFPSHVAASSVLVAARPTPRAVFAQVRAHKPTLFFGVPTAYANMLVEMDAGTSFDFGSVRVCASAGESLPAPILERWRDRTGLDILDGIGSTEIGHIFLSNRRGSVRPGSTGKAVSGYDLRLIDENDRDVSKGELGDLIVRGDSTAALYWNKHEMTKRTISGEWIRTGDKYFQDDEGYFFHAGRSDDMIKSGGIWVSPVEVEATLLAHPWVLECAVIGAADADGLHKPHAFVTLRAEADATSIEIVLREFVREKIAAYKAPRWITVVSELPKTATGKIQRFLLRKAAQIHS
jgi:benzoate-CoA ligase family protein